jgi:hypothetical protein
MTRRFSAPLLTLLLLAVTTPGIHAQQPPKREGFFFNIGLGAGSLGCSDCDERVTGLSGGIALGGALNPQWTLGAFSNGWAKSVDGVTLTAGTLVLGARFYPAVESGFFLLFGLGLGAVELAAPGFGSASETGTGALFGLGWDVRIAEGVSLTPFWNGAGIAFSDGDANFGQLGVGFTIH